VHDVGVEVWGQPDTFLAYDAPGGDDVALVDGPLTQDELFASPADGGRLLSTTSPASPPGVTALSRALVTSGSLVLVTGAGPARLDAIAAAERVTRRLS
jgi:hypothetical protein